MPSPAPCTAFLSKPDVFTSILAIWHGIHSLQGPSCPTITALWQLEAALNPTANALSFSNQGGLRKPQAAPQAAGSLLSQALSAAYRGGSSSPDSPPRQPARGGCQDSMCACSTAVRPSAEATGPRQLDWILQQLHSSLMGAAATGRGGGAEPMDCGDDSQSRWVSLRG